MFFPVTRSERFRRPIGEERWLTENVGRLEEEPDVCPSFRDRILPVPHDELPRILRGWIHTGGFDELSKSQLGTAQQNAAGVNGRSVGLEAILGVRFADRDKVQHLLTYRANATTLQPALRRVASAKFPRVHCNRGPRGTWLHCNALPVNRE
jgi:hypothetical protein